MSRWSSRSWSSRPLTITEADIAATVAAKLTGKLCTGAVVYHRSMGLYGRCWGGGGTEAVFVFVDRPVTASGDGAMRWLLRDIEVRLPDEPHA